MTVKQCHTCNFWENPYGKQNKYQQSACRRYAPMNTLVTTDRYEHEKAKFPITKGDNFCGEWQEWKEQL